MQCYARASAHPDKRERRGRGGLWETRRDIHVRFHLFLARERRHLDKERRRPHAETVKAYSFVRHVKMMTKCSGSGRPRNLLLSPASAATCRRCARAQPDRAGPLRFNHILIRKTNRSTYPGRGALNLSEESSVMATGAGKAHEMNIFINLPNARFMRVSDARSDVENAFARIVRAPGPRRPRRPATPPAILNASRKHAPTLAPYISHGFPLSNRASKCRKSARTRSCAAGVCALAAATRVRRHRARAPECAAGARTAPAPLTEHRARSSAESENATHFRLQLHYNHLITVLLNL
ncbi:hypothetical protein EVAR_76246_1 [Eumeta japonica]|uniref:Uncharacterized protein n=1 Tax=Eumeta variegata TaxID=151549 RepID=A0A4C1UNW6_EUMVA|nr:hypothetical protein EVAR_76246_1 [Eumeta japonica]